MLTARGIIESVLERVSGTGFITRCLRPGGVAVLHSIGRMTEARVTPWVTKYIFPGMYFPTLSELVAEMARCGLLVVDVENLRPHYALTLDAWRDRFETNADAIAEMFDERFVRMWRIYLNAAAAGFKFGDLNVWQVTCTRGIQDASPLTRRHLYAV